MTDIVSPDVRSRMMAGIRGKNTRPELTIRRELFRRGFRYRLHSSRLPGKPDLVFPKYRAVLFINGCFWHGHDCSLFRWPGTREEFWRKKIEGNRANDALKQSRLLNMGWRILTVWECALRGHYRMPPDMLAEAISTWIRGRSAYGDIRGVAVH